MTDDKIVESSKPANGTAGEMEPWPPEIPAGPLSPAALTPAVADVVSHAAAAPEYLAETAEDALRQSLRVIEAGGKPSPEKGDHRFADPAWGVPPYSYLRPQFSADRKLAEAWPSSMRRAFPSITPNSPLSRRGNGSTPFRPPTCLGPTPKFFARPRKQGGTEFSARLRSFSWRSAQRQIDPQGAAEAREFVVGRDVAVTPGQVVFRNELMELIQYAPATPQTRPEPLLIVPAWIMKYYILDLAPHHSLIRYLVGRGFTVFCISWRNPGADMAQTSFDDYRRLGPMTALDVIGSICGERPHPHARLLPRRHPAVGRPPPPWRATMTTGWRVFGLLAAQTDFSEPGELRIFIDETQLDQLDALMARQGYLDARQMAGAFNMLHARDLIWSRMIKTYLLGETEHPNDLMAWNADATRMPSRMHSHYLRALFLHNDLAEGRFEAAGGKVNLAAIAAPIFVVGTEEDHVSPWRSVFKIHRLNLGRRDLPAGVGRP